MHTVTKLIRKPCHGRIMLGTCITRDRGALGLAKAVSGGSMHRNGGTSQNDDAEVSVVLAMAMGSRRGRRRVHLRYSTGIKAQTMVYPTASPARMPSDLSHRVLKVSIPPLPWDSHNIRDSSLRLCAAIPSKGRWRRNQIIDHALNLLLRHGMQQASIFVFVIDKEYDVYRRSLDEAALTDIQIIVGRDGLTSQMNYIRRFFPAGTVILGCNDLLADVVQKIDERNSTPMPAGMLLHWAHHAHSMMQRYGVSLCGLAPSNCLLKMHISHISQKFGLVNGSLYLEINQRNPSVLCQGSGLIWDMEHTCRFRKSHGPALRYLMFAALCKYRQPGGHSTSFVSAKARQLTTDVEIQALAIEFPHLLKFTPMKYRSMSGFNYTCQRVGGPPFKLIIPCASQGVAAGFLL